MATKKGVWDLQDVRDEQLQGVWSYSAPPDPGTLFTVGQNREGQLGLNAPNSSHKSSPTQVPDSWWKLNPTYAEVPSTFAITTYGSLWAWGENDNHGQLGLNDTSSRSSPTQVGTNSNWAAYTQTEQSTTHAVTTDGELFGWGSGYWGTIGNNIDGGSTPNWRFSSPVQIPGTDWTPEINSAHNMIMAIKTNGTLWVWGGNSSGILGQNNVTLDGYSSQTQVGTDGNWNKVSRGGNGGEAYGIKNDGTLWAWGANNKGQLGLNQGYPALKAISSPTQVGTNTTWANIRIGESGAVATKTDGTLWTWGNNGYGTLGQNQVNDNKSSPVQVGTDTNWHQTQFVSQQYGVMALKTDGTVWGWGRNNNGQLGQNSSQAQYSSPIQIPGTYTQVGSAGKDAFCLGRP